MFTPKLSQAITTAFLCIVCMLIGVWMGEKYSRIWNIGALIFALMTAAVLWLMLIDAYGYNTDRMTEFTRAYSQLDEEGRAALAMQFPSMRYRIRRGVVRSYFEDTSVLAETFRLFLQDSNRQYIAPERNWNTTERPRADWEEIKAWLEANKKIHPDSAAGSHSWLWVGNSYDHLMAYWFAGRELRDYSEMESA